MEEKFRQLKVWQKAHVLALFVYKVTKLLPDDERFGMISQMRRAAVSVAANIVEGSKRRGIRERINFHSIADASLEELKYYFILCKDLGYIREQKTMEEFWNLSREVGSMLHGLSESLKQ